MIWNKTDVWIMRCENEAEDNKCTFDRKEILSQNRELMDLISNV